MLGSPRRRIRTLYTISNEEDSKPKTAAKHLRRPKTSDVFRLQVTGRSPRARGTHSSLESIANGMTERGWATAQLQKEQASQIKLSERGSTVMFEKMEHRK